ncbi:MAG: hypothetical protein GC180_11795 [Bacteroidetes bacterium]|nr:hypothetical protein [Bacteroidota bacterium]
MKLITKREDIRLAEAILADCYLHAPNITWFMEKNRKKACFFFSMVLQEAMLKKGAYLSEDRKGVLLLYPQGKSIFHPCLLLRKLMLVLFYLGPKKSVQLIKTQQIQAVQRPKTGLYGMALAILPHENLWKTQLEIKRKMNQIQLESGLSIYLETTNERYAILYEKLGFSIYQKIAHPYANLSVWFMKKDIPELP